MIELIISGGQSGADLGGWRAARRAGISCSGWMPKGFLTEDGPRPEYATLYGAKEHASREYPARTWANVEWADAVLWFGIRSSRGFQATDRACRYAGRPMVVVGNRDFGLPSDLLEWLRTAKLGGVRILGVAGNRESLNPGIAARVEAYLCEVFRVLGFEVGEGT